MEIEDLLTGRMSDEEKLKFYDSRIISLTDELSSQENNLYSPFAERETKRLNSAIQRFKTQREFLLDRLKLGLSAKPNKSNNSESRQIFIASWFDKTMDVYVSAIEKGIEEAGFVPVCIKDIHFPNTIMDKALSEIKSSRFVVIDLTGSRNSVFFEAGYCLGSNIETIYVYKKDLGKDINSLEFYVKHYQCYGYIDEEDLRKQIKIIIDGRIKNIRV